MREQVSLGYLALSHASWMQGDQERARSHFDRAIALSTDDVHAEAIRRRAPWARCRREMAYEEFEEMRAVSPDQASDNDSDNDSSADDDAPVICPRHDLRPETLE